MLYQGIKRFKLGNNMAGILASESRKWLRGSKAMGGRKTSLERMVII